MTNDFAQITARVRRSIDSYCLPAKPDGVGITLDREWFLGELEDLKKSTVDPSLAEMRDDLGEGLVVLQVVIVADDCEGTVIVFDPNADEFVLASLDADPVATRSVNLVSCGVRGDVVDCFMAR